MSPAQRTLKLLRKQGYCAQVVEKWNAFARVRQDLFGCIDVLGIRPGEILGVQATTVSNQARRLQKALQLPGLRAWLLAGGRMEVWGWGKKGLRGKRKVWEVTRQCITIRGRALRVTPGAG